MPQPTLPILDCTQLLAIERRTEPSRTGKARELKVAIGSAAGLAVSRCGFVMGIESRGQPCIPHLDLHQATLSFLALATTNVCHPNWCSSQRNTGRGNARKYHGRSYWYCTYFSIMYRKMCSFRIARISYPLNKWAISRNE